MVRQLRPSPLPGRIAPPTPLRNWLWSDQRAYDGVLVSTKTPDRLLPFLQYKGALRQIDDLYCFAFDAPVDLDPALLGSVLPFRAIGNATLTTYDLSRIAPKDRGVNRLHIVRCGQPVSYDLYTAITVDPLQFWDLTGLDVVPSIPLPKPAKAVAPAPTPASQIPRQSASLAQVAQAKPIYADIHDAVNAAKSTYAMDHVRQGGRLLRGLAASFVLVVFVITLILIGFGVLVTGANSGWLGLLVAACIIYGLWLLVSGRQTVGSARTAGQAARQAAPPQGSGKAREPGLLDRLKSWALWNSSLGDKLRADLARHIKDVSRMIENGEIDRALKRAVALGAQKAAEDKRRNIGPISVPKPRGTLDMDLSGSEVPTSAILNDRSFLEMAVQYRELAQKLSADGDHRRAAFIYSELLKDVPQALSELEKLKAFEDAAKLATARKSPGHITARLWFLAGKKDIALALAKRYDAMEFIANTAEKHDPEFAAFVRGHWVKDLITAGDLSGAVMQSAGRPALKTLHIAVTQQAILAGLLDEAPVLVAASTALDWRVEALNNDFGGGADDGIGRLETYLHQLIYGAEPADAPARQALIAGLAAQMPKTQSTLDTFWTNRAPPLADAAIRAALAYDVDHPAVTPLAELRRAAKTLNLTVMAEDLRHVVRANPQAAPTKQRFALPPVPPARAQHWTMIACVGNGQTLLGAANGELTLLDAAGRRRWTDQMNALVGIVPIGPGRLVILVQANGHDKQLTLLDTALHSYRDLGRVSLVAWHQTASAATWLVQTPQAIGALDISVLLDDAPGFDFLWSVTQTVPIIVLGFQVGKHQVQWLSQRVNNGRPGLTETWVMRFSNQDLVVRTVDPAVLDGQLIYQSQHLWTVANQFWPATQSVSPQWQPQYRAMRFSLYDFEDEQKILPGSRSFFESLTEFAQIVAAPEGACAVNCQSTDAPNVVVWQQKGQPFIILEGTTFSAQFSHFSGRRLAVIDDRQRIIISDFDRGTVTVSLP